MSHDAYAPRGELSADRGAPARARRCSRRTGADVQRLVIERGVCDASRATVLRWLAEDAIRPWHYRSWIFPTDPDFGLKAGRILDLYAGRWDGQLLHPGDCVIAADGQEAVELVSRQADGRRVV